MVTCESILTSISCSHPNWYIEIQSIVHRDIKTLKFEGPLNGKPSRSEVSLGCQIWIWSTIENCPKSLDLFDFDVLFILSSVV